MKVSTRRLCFDGTFVRFKVYTPADSVTSRAAFCCSPFGDCESWDVLCRLLAERGCLCVTFELPGFGHTPVNAPQSNQIRAQILWGVLDEVEISRGESPARWHLVGHGSGCGVILEMAKQHPDSVISRAFLSPVTEKFQDFFSCLLINNRPGRWILSKVFNHYADSPDAFAQKVKKLYACEVSGETVTRLYKEFKRRGRFETLLRLFEQGYHISKKAWAVTVPLFMLGGRQDYFGGSFPKKLMKKLSDVEIHYEDTGHMPMETMPQELSQYLGGWFASSEGRQKTPVKKKK